jgi:hypothetical protein
MESRPDSTVIERVRKILKRTEQAGCTQAESEQAFQVASRLMAEHNLDMATIDVADSGPESQWEESEVAESQRWTLEDNLACGIVKNYFFVEPYLKQVGKGGPKTLIFFGRAENIQAATFVFDALHRAFDRLFMHYRIVNDRPASERRMFIAGVCAGFTRKLKDERAALEIERDCIHGTDNGTAIMLASVSELTKQKFDDAHGALLKSAKKRFAPLAGDRSALEAGIEAGRKLNLSRKIGGVKPKSIS